MTLLDFLVLGVIGLSTVVGLLRGLVREAVSLTGWIVAFFLAKWTATPLAEYLPHSWSPPTLRWIVAFLVLYVLFLILLALGARMLAGLLKRIGLGPLDQGLGGFFGFLRGLLVVTVAAMLAGLTDLPKSPSWREAWLVDEVELLGRFGRLFLPEKWAEHIRYQRAGG
jgi:membrane protein required for colicin V production